MTEANSDGKGAYMVCHGCADGKAAAYSHATTCVTRSAGVVRREPVDIRLAVHTKDTHTGGFSRQRLRQGKQEARAKCISCRNFEHRHTHTVPYIIRLGVRCSRGDSIRLAQPSHHSYDIACRLSVTRLGDLYQLRHC